MRWNGCSPCPSPRTPRPAVVLEKAGYRLEGCMRRSAVKDGVVQDQLLYDSLRGDGARRG